MYDTQVTWYDDTIIDGAPYITRHPDPGYGDSTEDYLGDLTGQQRQHLIAVHEAAHAVATLAGGGYVHHATIRAATDLRATTTREGAAAGQVYSCNLTDGQAHAVHLAAGERAEERWLHHTNLWTPARAYGIELGAVADRRLFFATNPHFGFGTRDNDYRVVHDLADQLVTDRWDAIATAADALASRLHLTGDEIADLTGLANGTHSATCKA